MEIHQLRGFIAIAETGSFSQAAQKCHVAQSSLSKSIQKLEAEADTKLFVRLKRRTVVTPAGSLLLARARRALNEIEAAKRELVDARSLRRGSVTVGALPTISPYFLPRVITQFTQKCPDLQMNVVEETTENLLRLVDKCEVDLALTSLPIPNNGFDHELLFREELLLAVPSTHRLAVQDKVALSDLESERFILMKDEHCLADQVIFFCKENDVRPAIVHKASQIETVQSLVMAGVGVSLVPQMARINGRISLVYRSLEKPTPTRSIMLVWRKAREHTRAAEEFFNQLRQAAKAFTETLRK